MRPDGSDPSANETPPSLLLQDAFSIVFTLATACALPFYYPEWVLMERSKIWMLHLILVSLTISVDHPVTLVWTWATLVWSAFLCTYQMLMWQGMAPVYDNDDVVNSTQAAEIIKVSILGVYVALAVIQLIRIAGDSQRKAMAYVRSRNDANSMKMWNIIQQLQAQLQSQKNASESSGSTYNNNNTNATSALVHRRPPQQNIVYETAVAAPPPPTMYAAPPTPVYVQTVPPVPPAPVYVQAPASTPLAATISWR